jgi:hypothetical protein
MMRLEERKPWGKEQEKESQINSPLPGDHREDSQNLPSHNKP